MLFTLLEENNLSRNKSSWIPLSFVLGIGKRVV